MRRIAAIAAVTGALVAGAVATPAEAATTHPINTAKSGVKDTGGVGYWFIGSKFGQKTVNLHLTISDYHRGDHRLACLRVVFTRKGYYNDARTLFVSPDGAHATGNVYSYDYGRFSIRECKGYANTVKVNGKPVQRFKITTIGKTLYWN